MEAVEETPWRGLKWRLNNPSALPTSITFIESLQASLDFINNEASGECIIYIDPRVSEMYDRITMIVTLRDYTKQWARAILHRNVPRAELVDAARALRNLA